MWQPRKRWDGIDFQTVRRCANTGVRLKSLGRLAVPPCNAGDQANG